MRNLRFVIPVAALVGGTALVWANKIEGIPAVYTPGTTYNLTVRLGSSATAGDASRRWGFEVTAARLSDGLGTGSFTIPAGLRKPTSLNLPEYVTHTSTSRQITAASPVEPVTWGRLKGGKLFPGDFSMFLELLRTGKEWTQ